MRPVCSTLITVQSKILRIVTTPYCLTYHSTTAL